MSFSDVLRLAGVGQRDAAAILLKEEFGKLQSPEQRVNLCRWIASCFEGLRDYGSAAEWYEMTGLLSLGETSSDAANAIRALPEYEKARQFYTLCEDDEKVELCDSVIAQLKGCFAGS
ncbi:MAG: hypothetical protein JRM86_05115 [Nitrososphaerota archaeon]|jgi:hypothetical protein|nr:hypothetical protein [Nitrososphaerota archaeon]MDG6966983.1 hypothetical protein [Nitrososphaerota archaeon]MDG6978994.1 hypothetical protein [Nitrososphaerota archaeon]MDG7006295.1 hypothetical protein [Nitrososphaerota archaeon]MDG7020950.1 hypothetical protein [Nitrososphaerota archaeon]